MHLTLLNSTFALRNIPSFTKFDEFRKTNSNNISSYSALTAYKTGARWGRNVVNVPTGCKFFSKAAKRRNSSNRFQFPERWRSWLSPTLVYNQTKDAVLNSWLYRVLQGNRTDSEKLCKLTEWLVVNSRARTLPLHLLNTTKTKAQTQKQVCRTVSNNLKFVCFRNPVFISSLLSGFSSFRKFATRFYGCR